ncbi:MAG: hypothetical protein ACI8ZB_002828 [Desulforhopalus sp.]|jgi:hypothetical protein
MNKETLEKILEYASMPVHGTLSRKLRKDVKLQVNEGKIYENATLFLGEGFARITELDSAEAINTYYGWDTIASIRTLGKSD